MPGASEMWVLVRRERRINLLRARERSKGLLLLEDVQYRVPTMKAKVRAEVLARQSQVYVTIANSLDM